MSCITDNIEAINNHSCMCQSHIITPSLAFCSIMLPFCYFIFTSLSNKTKLGCFSIYVCFICEPYNVTNVNVQIDWFSMQRFSTQCCKQHFTLTHLHIHFFLHVHLSFTSIYTRMHLKQLRVQYLAQRYFGMQTEETTNPPISRCPAQLPESQPS